MAFTFSAEEQRKWLDDNRPRVEEKTGAPVVAFWVFYYTNSWGSFAMSKVSPLAASAMRLMAKKKAGGLPQNFVLALTEDRLHAFAYKSRRDGISVGKEVAVWDRAGIRTSAQASSSEITLTIESPSEGEKVVCATAKSPLTNEFFQHLGAVSAVAA